jgi:hypothetical protein
MSWVCWDRCYWFGYAALGEEMLIGGSLEGKEAKGRGDRSESMVAYSEMAR